MVLTSFGTDKYLIRLVASIMSRMENGQRVLPGQQTRPGRKRDASRDAAILAATLAVLAETGYERMTTDMVAARAKASKATMYRRWPSKAELVIDAVESLRDEPITAAPDTGTLSGDLTALIQTFQSSSTARKFQIMAGLLSILPRDPDLARVVQGRIVQPGTAVMRLLLDRAQERGEIGSDRDLDTLALVVPAMVAYRLIVTGEQIDRQSMTSIINEVLVPASSH
jgi:AcrR family transcriptional regulator